MLVVLPAFLGGALPALADKGSGHGGGGRSGGSSGSGSHGSGHSDDRGSGDDRSGHSDDRGNGARDDDGTQEDRADGARESGGDRQRVYAEGWRVEIRKGRYRVFDPNGRLVINRQARKDDYGKF
ncbi:hypothetical protein [Ensifer soli]|uniref:hypothetical protein n=1 Tax=Ciceribacter sp. sgz301302 TaxID=3342379 RepID=UPI0035BB9990